MVAAMNFHIDGPSIAVRANAKNAQHRGERRFNLPFSSTKLSRQKACEGIGGVLRTVSRMPGIADNAKWAL